MNVALFQLPTDETQIIRLERHLGEPDVDELDIIRTYSTPARRVRQNTWTDTDHFCQGAHC